MARSLMFSGLWPLPGALAVLAGCAVIADVKTYDAIATDEYSHSLENAMPAEALDPGCRWPCYRIGSSLISFYPASRGSNVKAMGPILPVIPVPGPGKDHGQFDFFVAVHVHPGKISLVIFRPGDFRIRLAGSEEAVEPNRVTRCDNGEPVPDVVRAYGEVQCFKVEFPVARSGLENFRMISPVFESDGTSYVLPDLQWSPGTYRVVE